MEELHMKHLNIFIMHMLKWLFYLEFFVIKVMILLRISDNIFSHSLISELL